MATTQVVRPNGNLATTGWTIAGNILPPTHWEAISQGELPPLALVNTHAYLRTADSAIPADCRFTMSTYTLAVDERCKRARMKTVEQVISSNTTGRSHFGVSSETLDGGTWNDTTASLKTGSWYSSYNGVAFVLANEWTQARIDALQCKGKVQSVPTGGSVRIWEMFVELEIIKAASATWDATALTQDMGRNALMKWVWAGNGEAQKAFQVRVFTEAQTLAGGFDPGVTVPVYDSGQVVSSAVSQGTGWVLNYNTAYVSFLKVAKDFSGETWWNAAWITSPVWKVTARPTATSVLPTGTIDTNQPVLSWTFNHNMISGSTTQTNREVRLYKRVGGTWPANGPDDVTFEAGTDLIYNGGQEVSSSLSRTLASLGINLLNLTEYRAYVKVAKTHSPEGSSEVIWSDTWAYSTFNTDFDAPVAPVVSTALAANGVDVQVTVTPGTRTVEPNEDYYMIERRTDGGVWEHFQLGGGETSAWISAAVEPFVVTDREARMGLLSEYRAFGVSTALIDPVASLASNIDSETIIKSEVWVKDLFDSSLNKHFYVMDQWLTRVKKKNRSIHRPLGRSKPMVVRGTAVDDAFSITFLVLGVDDEAALEEIIDRETTLFLQTPKGNWHVEVATDVSILDHLWDGKTGEEDVYQVTVPFQEVDT